MDALEVRDALGRPTGRFRRHPTQENWNKPEQMSRDQLLPLLAAMSVWDDHARLDRVAKILLAGTFAFLNKDWMDLFRQYIRRARNQSPDETIDHVLLDAAVLARLCCIEDADDVGDDLNLMVVLCLSEMPRQKKHYIPAIRAKFANNRPVNYGIYLGAYNARFHPQFRLSREIMVQRIEKGIQEGWVPDCSNTLGALKWYCARSRAAALDSSHSSGRYMTNIWRPHRPLRTAFSRGTTKRQLCARR